MTLSGGPGFRSARRAGRLQMQPCPPTAAPSSREELLHAARPIRCGGQPRLLYLSPRPSRLRQGAGIWPCCCLPAAARCRGGGAYAWDEAGRRCRREPALLWRSFAHATHPRSAPPDLAPPSHPPSTGATRSVMGGGPTILCSCGCRMAAGAPPPSSSASMSPPQPRRHGCRCGQPPGRLCLACAHAVCGEAGCHSLPGRHPWS